MEMIKKSVKVGNRIVDIDFNKKEITVSVWTEDTDLPLGYFYNGEKTFKT